MKPNDNNVILPSQQRPFRVLIISGSEPTESSGIETYSAMERAELKSSGRPPNKYRAFGYKPPKHIWASVQDGIRYFEMMIDKPPKGPSPQIQQDLDLNKDATLHTKKSEGKKLRGK